MKGLADHLRCKDAELSSFNEPHRSTDLRHSPSGGKQKAGAMGASTSAAEVAESLNLSLTASQAASALYASMICDEAEAEALRLAALQAASRAKAASGDTFGLFEAKTESLMLKARLAETHAALLMNAAGSRHPVRDSAHSTYLTDGPYLTDHRPRDSLSSGNIAPLTSMRQSQSSLRADRPAAPTASQSYPQARSTIGSPGGDLDFSDLKTQARHMHKELRKAKEQHESDREEMTRLRVENQQLSTLLDSAREVRTWS